MKALFDGITKKIEETSNGDHNDFYDDIGGRFYFTKAPQKVTWPFAVYHHISNRPEWSFARDQEITTIQINLYSATRSSVEICNIYTHLITLLDYKDTTLSVDGYGFVYIKRTSNILQRFEDRWQYAVTFETMISKANTPS